MFNFFRVLLSLTEKHMENQNKANSNTAWINGLVGVIMFSGSLPATRLAVMELDPYFVTSARAAIAGILALLAIIVFKEKLPSKQQIIPLLIVAFAVVLGFPLFSSLALQYISSAHSIVFVGILPIATAIFGIFRANERPRPIFWLFAIIGSLIVMGFAFSHGVEGSVAGNLLMLLAIVLCGLGYAEGAKLSKSLGGWQVISWALIISLPVSLPLSFVFRPISLDGISASAWLGLAYVSLFSMFFGFIFWYRGLAMGGIATIGQLQLLQPLFGLTLAAFLLHEQVSWSMLLVTVAVLFNVAATKKFAS